MSSLFLGTFIAYSQFVPLFSPFLGRGYTGAGGVISTQVDVPGLALIELGHEKIEV